MDKKLFLIATMCELVEMDEEEQETVLGRKRRRRIWQKNWLKEKREFSNQKLLQELKQNEPDDYKNFLRMDDATFNELLGRIRGQIQKEDTLMRDAIPPHTRLGIALRFLATGCSFEQLKFDFAVSPQSIGKIVMECCDAIIHALKDYIKMPQSPEDWKDVAAVFDARTGFPHCLGALDGKHIEIIKPQHSGSYYFNYKKRFSIVLFALVNCNCEFLMVDVGTNGKESDGSIFLGSSFKEKLESHQLNLPEAEHISFVRDRLPYVFVGDDAFALREDLLKPFGHHNLTPEEDNYNKRLSSARVKVENAFGILSSRFRVLRNKIELCPEKATRVTLACCYLHNFLRRRRGSYYTANSTPGPGQPSTSECPLIPLQPTSARNASTRAKAVQRQFCSSLWERRQNT